MASRKARKRYRRRTSRLAATADNPVIEAPGEQTAGGLGGTFQPRTRGDWQLVQQAVNEGWNTPPATRRAVCDTIGPALQTASDRQALAVIGAAMAMERANKRAEQVE
ncbi:MAG TPA: hypothetical protein VNH11_36045 [Pirellulales bacterium]|nr:hypothetical protein [Pirellulales bacterium]